MHRWLSILLVAFVTILPGRAQNDDRARNLHACIAGYGYCNHSQLSPTEAQEVTAAEHRRNLSSCISGYGYCNHAWLTASELSEVTVGEHRRNLSSCISGYGYCNHAWLTTSELSEVTVGEHRRNLSSCISGYGYCNHAWLTTSELSEVTAGERRRNLNSCKTGYGYCNHAQLTAAEVQEVGTTERTQAAAPTLPATSVAPISPIVPATVPGVAENGSYYGQPNANGIPKTVHVDGYYRKDGTYVRGRYRSPPGTNPPRHGHR